MSAAASYIGWRSDVHAAGRDWLPSCLDLMAVMSTRMGLTLKVYNNYSKQEEV